MGLPGDIADEIRRIADSVEFNYQREGGIENYARELRSLADLLAPAELPDPDGSNGLPVPEHYTQDMKPYEVTVRGLVHLTSASAASQAWIDMGFDMFEYDVDMEPHLHDVRPFVR